MVRFRGGLTSRTRLHHRFAVHSRRATVSLLNRTRLVIVVKLAYSQNDFDKNMLPLCEIESTVYGKCLIVKYASLLLHGAAL